MWGKTGWNQGVEEEGLNVLGGMRAEEVMTGKYPPDMESTEGILECGVSGGDVSGVPDEK